MDDLRLLKSRIGVHVATGEDRARLFEENCRLRRENQKLRNMSFISQEYADMIESDLLGRLKTLTHELGRSRAAAGPSPHPQELAARPESGEIEWLKAENARLKFELEKRDVILASLIHDNPALETRLAGEVAAGDAASRDPLTQLHSRRKFNSELVKAYREMCDTGRPLSLILFDIDNLKAINESRGRDAGDEVLRCVARTASANIPRLALCTRWSGEEFMVMDVGADLARATGDAERLRLAIREARPAGLEGVTCSFGVVQVWPLEEPQSIRKRLLGCMRRAKEAGRDRVSRGDAPSPPLGHYDE